MTRLLLAAALLLAGPAAFAQTPDAAEPAPAEAGGPPANWHLLDRDADGVAGISLDQAYADLAGRTPRAVVVAILDSGVDVEHPDLAPVLWTNSGEIAGNGLDDDGNGYVDDVHGWSFIGGPGGSIEHDTLELARLVAACRRGAPDPTYSDCDALEAELETQRAPLAKEAARIAPLLSGARAADAQFRATYGDDYDVTALDLRGDEAEIGRPLLFLAEQGASLGDLEEYARQFNDPLAYSLNPDYDARGMVGDDYADTDQRDYGSADVAGPDPNHGTGVAGLVAAVRGNDLGIDGIAPAQIMVVRTVPGGDERDKDVANAIRYAADNGAHVINMSFGKSYSPQKAAVDAAVAYAVSKGVLLVHAAGNSGQDIDTADNFPNRRMLDGTESGGWLEVGASGSQRSALAAGFSNYGQANVDLFAPGDGVTSLKPGGGIQTASGTSFASPVVAGVAALVMAYFPELSADEVRQVLLDASARYAGDQVARPGDGEMVPFESLSVSGGVLDAAAAVRLAAERSAAKM